MQTVQILGYRRAQTLPALLDEIARDREAGRRVFVLVPEQYTLQAELELVNGLRLPGLLDIDVLSPRNLERLIEDRAGRPALPRLSDAGRAMAFAQALMDCGDELQCYHRAAERFGLPDRLSALVGDLEKALVTPEELREIAEKTPSEGLRLKLEDILRVWEAYRERLQNRFAEPIAAEQDLRQRLAGCGLMQGASLYVCGFDNLQSSLMSLLAEAARQAHSVRVALTMDQPGSADARIFLTQRLTAQELQRRLAAEGIPCQWIWVREEADAADAAPAIRCLEKHLFARTGRPMTGSGEAVRLHTAADPYEEATACAATLLRWHEEGLAWERMAVALASSDESLMGVMDATLEAAGIPHFISRKDAAIRHGLIRLLIFATRAVYGGYQQEDMLGLIKSGFAPLSAEESQRLENYALENGINRGRWRKPFTRGQQAEAAEELRQRLMEPLERMHERLRQSRDAAGSVEALYRLLEETDAYQLLQERERELLEAGLDVQAGQNSQVWQLLMALMDQMATLLGDCRATLAGLPRLLEAGLSGAALAALPPAHNEVLVGAAGHILTGQVEALALLGMQDGVTAGGADSLLTDAERGAVSHEASRSIGLSRAEQNALRQADFYRTITLPSRYLYISCSASDQQGAALRPSILMGDIHRLLPDAPFTGGAANSDSPLLFSPQKALEEAAPRLRAALDANQTPDEDTLEVMRQLLNDPRWAGAGRRVMAALRAENKAGPLPPEKAERLYRSEHVSVSRLEDYAQCPFRGFVTRGLRPVSRRDWAFEADERGSFYHKVLERYTALAAQHSRWPELSDEEEEALFEEAVAPVKAEWVNGPLDDDALGRREGEELVRTVHTTARMFTGHARRRGFSSSRAEVRFGRGESLPPLILELPDGSRTALEGTIDRIDYWEGEGQRFLSVVDNKSGHRSLEKERVWFGLQLQLLIYLKAAAQADPALPGGAFYFRIQDPLVKEEGDLVSSAEKELAKAMQLKGVVLADTRVIDAMNSGEYNIIDSPFLKDGTISKSKLACTLEELRHLMDHAAAKAAELTQEMRSGRIDLAPAAIGSFDACSFCPLSSHCPLDEQLPGTHHRHLDVEDKEELWQKMIGNNGQGAG